LGIGLKGGTPAGCHERNRRQAFLQMAKDSLGRGMQMHHLSTSAVIAPRAVAMPLTAS